VAKKKKCPFCAAEVNKENFNKHLFKVHKDLDKEEFKKEGLKKPSGDAARKKSQTKGKTGQRKRRLKKKDRVSTAITAVVVIVIVILVGILVYHNFLREYGTDGEEENNGNGGEKRIAVMTTTMGTIKLELDVGRAPVTAGNFIALANDGFYDGIIFHRVIQGFVIQAGGYNSNEEKKDADNVQWEDTGLLNLKYTISMARIGDANNISYRDTGSSQFFINLADNRNSLDSPTYSYVVFGRVIEGFSVVDAIAQLPKDSNDWPDDPPVITSVVIEG
jgi:cyclophilin family peptidyl-prolyl cis-trans isomerase